MAENHSLTINTDQHAASYERRGKPRIECSYPALVRVHNTSGSKYESQAILSNMSASGMYLNMDQHIEKGDSLFIVVRLSSTSAEQNQAPQIAAQGHVVRIEVQPDGAFGVAVNLHNHRFL